MANRETIDDMIKTLAQLKKHPEENERLISDLGELIENSEAELKEQGEMIVIEEAPKVSLKDLEEFFDDNETPLEELPDHIHEFQSLEDLKDTITEEGEFVKPKLLSLEEIAEIAYNTVDNYETAMFDRPSTYFRFLSESDRKDVVQRAHDIMHTASNNDDIGIARAQHSQKAMTLLAEGYRYGAETDEENKISPEVAPWEFLKNEYRMPTMLFRDIVRRLVMSVWSGS